MTSSVHPLRVAYIAARLDPGGAELQMLALAERLPPDEFRVDFICLSRPGSLGPRALAAGARVFTLGSGPPDQGSPIELARHRARIIGRFVRLVRRNRYDIVDAWMYPAYDIAALTRPFTRVPVVIAGRRNMREPDRRYGLLERAADAVARRLCDVTVANSQAAAEWAIDREHLDPVRVRVIRNGVEPFALGPGQRELVRARWGADAGEVVIGCVANHRSVKALDLLISAFGDLASTRVDIRLVLVGDGPERPRLERLIVSLGLGTRVVLHGREPNARELNAGFDIVALSSKSEGLPNVILEAGAAGLPVVATDVGGVREVVVDGVTGLLVPSGDRQALSAALGLLTNDPGLRGRMGQAAREHVASTFGMTRFVAETAKLYREVSTLRAHAAESELGL